jgi:hypothetical protein
MVSVRTFGLSVAAILAVACGGGGTGTTRPTTGATVPPVSAAPSGAPSAGTTAGPSIAPSVAPTPTTEIPLSTPTPAAGASLDPSLSDAGIVARVTITGDAAYGKRDGTYDVIAVDDDGSECSPSFEGDEFIAVAWYDDAPIGQIHRFGISVDAADIPADEGTATDVEDGRVSFDFVSETGIGTQYTGAAADDDGFVTLDITRSADAITFDFDGQTYVGVQFSGQMICARLPAEDAE